MDNQLVAPSLLPIVPEALARQHDTFVATDSRFKSAARLLAALWRTDKGLPAGSFVDNDKRRRRVGSMLTHADGRNGLNFISDQVRRLAWRESHYREIGAAFDLDRLRRNLLSSQTLAFNLFGPMKIPDLDRATAVFSELLPDIIGEVVGILFEHSPGRGDSLFTNDYSALDVLILVKTVNDQRLLIGIEVKYTETCWERVPRIDPRHMEIAAGAGLFIDSADPALVANPTQQLFRLTCLMQSMLDNGLADEALLLFIAPDLNTSAQAAAKSFQAFLAEPRSGKVGFGSISLETVFAAIAAAGGQEHHDALFRRYVDWHQVIGEVDLYADEIHELPTEQTENLQDEKEAAGG